MHNRMQPENAAYWQRVQSLPFGPIYEYEDVAAEVGGELEQSLALAQALGAPRWLLVIDPGIGFGKTVAQQLELIDRLDEVRRLGYPLLFGSSRKSFIGKVLGDLPPEKRIEGTLATCVLAVERGADIVRVHDVRAAVRAVRMADAIVRRNRA
jgi:dihydropteroate synthase